MNRPKREDFYIIDGSSNTNIGWSDKERRYAQVLEKYCDEIESKLEIAIETILILDEKLNFIEKALDKACEKLAFTSNEHIIEELGSFTLSEINRTKEQWKEWLMLND